MMHCSAEAAEDPEKVAAMGVNRDKSPFILTVRQPRLSDPTPLCS